MKKLSHREFETFAAKFQRASARAGKEQYLVPYFIAIDPLTMSRPSRSCATARRRAR